MTAEVDVLQLSQPVGAAPLQSSAPQLPLAAKDPVAQARALPLPPLLVLPPLPLPLPPLPLPPLPLSPLCQLLLLLLFLWWFQS